MKRLSAALILIVLLSIFPTASVSANAAGYGYARAETKASYFYSEKDKSTMLFAVPKGYCIEILRDDGEWYYARYASDSGIYREKLGYCRKEHFTPVQDVPTVTYLYKTVSVNFKADKVSGVLPTLGDVSLEAAYYGALTFGDIDYAYVYCQGTFGYIEGKFEEDVADVFKPEGGNGTSSDGGGWSAGLISVIIILALFVAVIVVLHFVTANGKKKDV